jgi:hypothetical protein
MQPKRGRRNPGRMLAFLHLSYRQYPHLFRRLGIQFPTVSFALVHSCEEWLILSVVVVSELYAGARGAKEETVLG